jgi:hypothetical protein
MPTLPLSRSPTPPLPAELRPGYAPPPLPAAGASRTRRTVFDPLDRAAAEQRELKYDEMVLINAFEEALDVGFDHLTPLCKQARISISQIELHADEIDVAETLTRDQINSLRRFVQFMTLAQALQIITFEGELAGRSVLGYQRINIAAPAQWQAVLAATCGLGKYFQATSTVYETLAKFGYKGKANAHAPVSNVSKKARVLLYSETFTFAEEKLASNLPRYTNSQMKMPRPARPHNGLDALFEAAKAAGGSL